MAVKTRRSVAGVIAHSKARPETDWSKVSAREQVRLDAADAAGECRELRESGASLNDLWRFGVLQSLDYYNSALKVGGVGLAAQVFERAPDPTGCVEVDAAFAALAEHLACRDGWVLPTWSLDDARKAEAWYVPQSAAFYAQEEAESPPAFRQRGIYIATDDLSRA